MPGITPRAIYTFAFYKKGTEPSAFIIGLGPHYRLELMQYAVLLFSECGDKFPRFIQQLVDGLEEIE